MKMLKDHNLFLLINVFLARLILGRVADLLSSFSRVTRTSHPNQYVSFTTQKHSSSLFALSNSNSDAYRSTITSKSLGHLEEIYRIGASTTLYSKCVLHVYGM